jgi:dipeptidyl aminopeptidase/acylaminoacyl peptidase
MPSAFKILLAASLGVAACWCARADSVDEQRLELLFRPPLGEQMALSTDGHYLAYTEHTGTDLTIVVLDLETLKTKTRILADEDRPIPFSKEKERTQLRFLDWADGHRLVFAPTVEAVDPPVKRPSEEVIQSLDPEVRAVLRALPAKPTKFIAPVMAVDADGGHPTDLDKTALRTLVDEADSTTQRGTVVPRLRGFGTGKYRGHLLVELHGILPGDPTELFWVNVETGAHTSVNRQFGAGNFTYDWAHQPRLDSFSDERHATGWFKYRAPKSKDWVKMPEPPDADAGAHFTTSPDTYFGPRVTALGFDFDPNVLIYASNVGRDTFGIFGMDLRTRQRTSLAVEVPHRDLVSLDTSIASSPLVFDAFREKLVGVRGDFGPRPFSVWIDPELAAIQHAVDTRFPERSVQLLQWNEARTRFIARATGGADPGSIFLVRRPEGSMTELTRSAPWLAGNALHETEFFEFSAPKGAQLTGYLTLPRNPRINPPPVIIWFAPGLPPQAHPAFDPRAQVLADMGFVICRLNQRGVLGLGTEHREALRRDLDHASADDALAAIEWIAQRHRIDRKRVATLGEGFAGHLAVRATQLFPLTFRCAVIFDPILHLVSWLQLPPGADGPPTFRQQTNRLFLERSGVKLADLAVTAHPDQLNAATFIAVREGQSDHLAAGVSDLQLQLKRRDIACVVIPYNEDFTHGLPAARARVYRALEEFLNLNLYDYDVRIGPAKALPDKAAR